MVNIGITRTQFRLPSSSFIDKGIKFSPAPPRAQCMHAFSRSLCWHEISSGARGANLSGCHFHRHAERLCLPCSYADELGLWPLVPVPLWEGPLGVPCRQEHAMRFSRGHLWQGKLCCGVMALLESCALQQLLLK